MGMRAPFLVAVALIAAVLFAQPSNAGEVTCTACELIVGILETNATSPGTIAKLETFIDARVCDYLASDLEAECKKVVDSYAGPLMDLLVSQLPPKTVCTVVSICNGTSNWPHNNHTQSCTTTECEVCDFVVSELADLLSDPATLGFVLKYASGVCDLVPNAARAAECRTIVASYGPAFIDLLISHISPIDLCLDLGLALEA